MNHSEAKLILPWYLNDTLSEDERRLIERHLKSCGQCRKELEEWEATQAAVQDQEEALEGPSEELLAGALAQIRKESSSRRSSRLTLVWAMRLAAGVLLAVFTYQNFVQIPYLNEIALATSYVHHEFSLKGQERGPLTIDREYCVLPIRFVPRKEPAETATLRGALTREGGRRLEAEIRREDGGALLMSFAAHWREGRYQLTIEENQDGHWLPLKELTMNFDLKIKQPNQE